jgi:phosphoglycerate kinase
MKLRTLDDVDVAGKRALLRSDLNVPLSGGAIANDYRIEQSLPTIRELLERGAQRVVICAHLGRPKGTPDPKYSLAPVAARLGELLHETVPLAETPTCPVPDDARVALLENVRFDARENTNDAGFAQELARLADVYVDDAFGAVHRAHASVAAIATLLPSAAGRLLQKEVEVLGRLLENPDRPYVAVVGGAKVSDKLGVLDNLLKVVDRLVIGGAMCFTFLMAQGMQVGTSLKEEDQVDHVAHLITQAGDKLLLPTDFVVAEKMEPGAPAHTVKADAIPPDMAGYDIGKETSRAYVDAVRAAKTVMWNGPMGVFEIPEFESGTRAVAAAVAKGPAYSVVGGGDSIAALEKFGYANEIDHASTGGGAMLELLEGKELPGLTPLRMD